MNRLNVTFCFQSLPASLIIIIAAAAALAMGGCSDRSETPDTPESPESPNPAVKPANGDAAQSAGGGPAASDSDVANTGDPSVLWQAKTELHEIRNRIIQQREMTPEIVAQLADLHRRFPQDDNVVEILTSGYRQFQNWSELADLLMESPPPDRTVAQQLDLGNALVRAERHDEAFELLDPLVEANPDNIELAAHVIDAAFHTERFDRAAALLDRFWTRFVDRGDMRMEYERAVIHYKNGENDQALTILASLLQRAPSHAAAHETLSQVLLAKGETKLSEDHMNAATFIRSQHTRPEAVEQRLLEKSQLLLTAWNKTRYPECEKYIMELLPHVTGEERAVLYQFQARVFEAQGKLDHARGSLRMAERELAKSKSPNDPPAAPQFP